MAVYRGGRQQQETNPRGLDRPDLVPEAKTSVPGMGQTQAPRPAPVAPITPQSEILRNQATSDYSNTKLGYNPYMQGMGPQLQAMNFNPYQQAAVNQGQSSAATALANQQAMLQNTGGMGAADRIRAFQDFNKQKIMGTLGGTQKYDAAAGQNQLDVGRYNQERMMDVNRANLGMKNEANRDLAQQVLTRDQNLYQSALNERNLTRQLDAAQKISEAQIKAGQSNSGILDRLLNPTGTSISKGRVFS